MFGFLKNFLRKSADEPAQDSESAVATFNRPAASPSHKPFVPTAQLISQPPVVASRHPHPQGNGNGGGSGNGNHSTPKTIQISLQPVIDALPLELHPRIIQRDVGTATISVPIDVILSQLPRGAVALSYGQLRQAAPFAFSHESDRDKTPVPLPLGEIISQLNPALISRRRAQRQVEVPSEIVSPFESGSQSVVYSAAPAKPEPLPVKAPAPRQTSPPAPLQMSSRAAFNPAQTSPPPATAPLPHLTMVSAPRPVPELAASPRQPIPQQPIPQQPAPPQPAPTNSPTGDEPLVVGLTALAESWPDSIRKEIVMLNLVETKVALPAEVIEQGLRQGRLAFPWKTLRSWLKSGSVPAATAQDAVVLELPLKVVAPMFLSRKRESAKDQQRVNVNTEIPNLFFGFPQPESSTTGPVSKPVDTNYYVWEDTSDTARVHIDEYKKSQASPGTRFVSKCATPNEVVSRAAALDGVAGALIALPDGLMVASRLSPDLNGDTLAAFLPQIFGKVTQCTKELRMGELNNLNFTVGNVPWKIFRVNAIFFAAFGRTGEALPTAQLAALAAELDHRAK